MTESNVQSISYDEILRAQALGPYPYLLVQLVPEEDGSVTVEFESGNMGDDPPRTKEDFIDFLRELIEMIEQED